jgi:DNA-binding NarL/FixJ family response regulator
MRALGQTVGAGARTTATVLVADDPRLARALASRVGEEHVALVEKSALLEAVTSTPSAAALVLSNALSAPPDLQFVERIRRNRPRVPLLVCTSLRHADLANRIHLAGAAVAFLPDLLPSALLFVSRSLAVERDVVRCEVAACRALASRCDLTTRETEVLELVAVGVSRSDLAHELGISENTAKTLIRRTLIKLGEASVERAGRAVLEEALERMCAARFDAAPILSTVRPRSRRTVRRSR